MTGRLIAWAFLSAGFVLLGLTAYSFLAAPDGPGLVVSDTDIEVSGCLAGQGRSVTVRLHNQSRHLVRVVGLAEC